MEFFELAAADISALDDGQLRELVARLAEAEMLEQGLARSSVHAGGAQEAGDGGLDVVVATTGPLTRPNFVPRTNTGFQVKKHSMSRMNCQKEMLDKKGRLKPSIRALTDTKGAYIIVSGKDSCSASMHAERIAGMKEALKELPQDHDLALEFYGSDRLALWLKSHPGVALWARTMLGRPLAGWHPYGRWAASPPVDKDEFLADGHPCVIDGSANDKKPKPVLDGIQLARERLKVGTRAVRITGLSGVGKTRFAQALFEEDVGEDALPALDVLYADLGEELSPSASAVVTYLIANRLAAYVVLDNCPPATHRSLQKQLSASSAPLHLLTIEYDISDDSPEQTDVIHIEPSSEDTVTELLLRRFKQLNRFNAARIAGFAGGNARVALALADRVEADETLSSFTDEELFRRLFSQRKGESADLLRSATVLSLVYSFNVSRTDEGDELAALAAISEIPRSVLQRDQTELLRRQLAQKRGNWRAVLPHALATRLAKRALDEYEPEDINRELFKAENIRLFQSCAHRLGYLHESERARGLALKWLQPEAPLADIGSCDEARLLALDHVAPVFPEIVLRAIEKASETPGFADRSNSNAQRFVALLAALAYESSTFDRAADILLKYALTERRGENNNSIVGRLRQLMSLHLSGTMASPAQRHAFIQRLLASHGTREREIARELLDAAFEANTWTAFGGFHFGARARGSGWRPNTEGERVDWYEGFLAQLQPILGADHVSREWSKSVIADNFRQLWGLAGCSNTLESLVLVYGSEGSWPAIWLAIGKTLEYDGAGFDPAIRSRLEAMQALSAPVDLESKINTYAFVAEWSQPGRAALGYEAATEALRDQVIGLGKALWADTATFNRLSPKIWTLRLHPVAWLGKGFAEAGPNLDATLERVVTSFHEFAPDGASIAFLEGCLASMHEAEPTCIPRVLQRLLEVPRLKPHAIDILVATPISPWASAKLVELARQGEFQSHYFEAVQYGRRHELMSDVDFASLLNAVSALPKGYLSSLRMLVMRLFGKAEWNYEPGDEIFASARIALGYLLREHDGSEDIVGLHGIGPILTLALGTNAPDKEVKALVAALYEGLQSYRIASDLSEVLSAFIKSRPEMLLDALFATKEDSEAVTWMFRRRSGRPSPSLNMASVNRLVAWCGTDSERFEFVANNIRVYESENIDEDWDDARTAVHLSSHFRALWVAAPEKRALVEIAAGQAIPTSWMNSRIGIIETRRQALRELLLDPSPEIQALVGKKLEWLKDRIVRERGWEEAEHHQSEQRFE